MNFFEHQDQARKKTGQLILLFCLAVVALILMTSLLLAAFIGVIQTGPGQTLTLESFTVHMDRQHFAWITLIVLVVVGGGSGYKLAQLASGGKAVATMLGGTRVSADSKDPDQQKLLNVVEEMAIASGTPVPPVYLLQHESGINAFAAGFYLSDAVIGVTQGCIQQLDRDELQGVIAHEFSHILHGDMRINLHIMGVLHGILLIGLMGNQLLRSLWWTRSRKKDSSAAIGIIGLAVGLIVIGFSGLFFGNLIKAAVSRQREFLADASAVKYTRNPNGIASALKKIGNYPSGSGLEAANAEAASHMLFGQTTRHNLWGLFATHPPLEDRIKRIEPGWKYRGQRSETVAAPALDQSQAQYMSAGVATMHTMEQAVAQIGEVRPEDLLQAQKTRRELPEDWWQQAHTELGARAVIYALLVDASDKIARDQYIHIRNLDPLTLENTQALVKIRDQLHTQYRLSLVDMALPQLASMDRKTLQCFSQSLNALIRADQRISLFEWCLHVILMRRLKIAKQNRALSKYKYRNLNAVKRDCQLLFSMIAVAGSSTEANRQKAFASACAAAELSELSLLSTDKLNINDMAQALTTLNQLYPLAKQMLLTACVHGICSDKHVTATELELVRAIAESLDVPMPSIDHNQLGWDRA